jgi:hypothetical protein
MIFLRRRGFLRNFALIKRDLLNEIQKKEGVGDSYTYIALYNFFSIIPPFLALFILYSYLFFHRVPCSITTKIDFFLSY